MDVLRYKIDVDTSSLQQEQARMQLMAQQQTMNMAGAYSNMMYPPAAMGNQIYAQQQAMMTAYQAGSSMGSMSGLDPRQALAQEAYMSSLSRLSPAQSNMVGLYGEPIMSPRSFTGSEYQYPRGFIPGEPDLPKMTAKSFFRNTGNLVMNMGFNAMGMTGLGFGTALDDPIYRQIQSMTELPMRQIAMGGLSAAHGIAQGGLMAASTGVMMGLGLGAMPVNLGIMAAGWGLHEGYKGVRDYMDTGDYFRDAMAPYIRSSRLGGGPDAKGVGQFQRSLGDIVAKDTTFTRDDYNNILSLAVDRGFMQTADNVGKATEVVENIGKNLKAIYRLGLKVKETNEFAEQMNSVGVNLAGSGGGAQRFAGMVSLAAFQSGQTMAQMMPSLVQAGQMYAQQGLAPSIGAQLHAQAQGIAGETIRSGGFTQEDLAYYGGRQGISESMTRAYGSLNRSGIGQLLGISMMTDPTVMGKMGNMTHQDLIKQMSNFSDPNTYYEALLRQPELSRKIGEKDPNVYGSKMLQNILQMYLQNTGRSKMGYGEFSQILMSPDIGMTPQDVRALLKEIEGSDKALAGGQESMANKIRQTELESYRNTTSILTSTGRKNWLEQKIERPIANFAAGLYETTAGWAEGLEHKMFEFATGAHVSKTPGKSDKQRANEFFEALGNKNQDSKSFDFENNRIAEQILKSSPQSSVLQNTGRRMQDEIEKNTRLLEISMNQRLSGSQTESKVTKSDVDAILEESRKSGRVTDMESLMKYISSQNNDNAKSETDRIVKAIDEIKISPQNIVNEASRTASERGGIVSGIKNPTLNDTGKNIYLELVRSGRQRDFVDRAFLSGGKQMQNPLAVQDTLLDQMAAFYGKRNFRDLLPAEQEEVRYQSGSILGQLKQDKYLTPEQSSRVDDWQQKMDANIAELPEAVARDAKKRMESSSVLKAMEDIGVDSFEDDPSKIQYAINSFKSSGISDIQNRLDSGGKLSKQDRYVLSQIARGNLGKTVGENGKQISLSGKLNQSLRDFEKDPRLLSYVLDEIKSKLNTDMKNSGLDQDTQISLSSRVFNTVFRRPDVYSEIADQYMKDRRDLDRGRYGNYKGQFSHLSDNLTALGITDSDELVSISRKLKKDNLSLDDSQEVLNLLGKSSDKDVSEMAGLGNEALSGFKGPGGKEAAKIKLRNLINKASKGLASADDLIPGTNETVEQRFLKGGRAGSDIALNVIDKFSVKGEGGTEVSGGTSEMTYRAMKDIQNALIGFQKQMTGLQDLTAIKGMLESNKLFKEFDKKLDETNSTLKSINDKISINSGISRSWAMMARNHDDTFGGL